MLNRESVDSARFPQQQDQIKLCIIGNTNKGGLLSPAQWSRAFLGWKIYLVKND